MNNNEHFISSRIGEKDEVKALAFSGTGTVELPAGLDLAGRAISFPGITDSALDATGKTVCLLVSAPEGLDTADIEFPSLNKWRLRVRADSIRAVKASGTILKIH